jgi:hypothetical protein
VQKNAPQFLDDLGERTESEYERLKVTITAGPALQVTPLDVSHVQDSLKIPWQVPLSSL